VAERLFAHSLNGRPLQEWEKLDDHLRRVAHLCEHLGKKFGAAHIGYAAGLWHDLGKAAPDWQAFLLDAGQDTCEDGENPTASDPTTRRRGPDHSSAGAIHARNRYGAANRVSMALQFAIAGHHAGLADRAALEDRLLATDKQARYASAISALSQTILAPSDRPEPPTFLSVPDTHVLISRRFETFVRMLFSSLVDADRLATEEATDLAHSSPGRPALRKTWHRISEYAAALDTYLAKFAATSDTPVNRARRNVLAHCREAAHEPQGCFTLTVPTGGGKTLSSLAFALGHAEQWGLDRVIVALPFLSILDQTADVYREAFRAFGDRALVEHHSNIRPERDTLANSLASENWDAPLIVTTQLQLFESLFSNRPRDCRKLHNLCRSVLILDEVQTLPTGLLFPILDQLQQLQSNYGLTLLLTTATQPALHRRQLGPQPFPGFHPQPKEIVPASEMVNLFRSLRRVDVHWPKDDVPIGFAELASSVASEPQVLAIVHSRKDARLLWQECEAILPGEVLHLSALMCPAHRRGVLGQVRKSLAEGHACRVVSTQLVEAGVDLDFAVVHRSMAGLESLAQAAGRCDREGRRTQSGRRGQFFVFRPQSPPPLNLRYHAEIATVMLRSDPGLDLFDPQTFRHYFDRLYAHRSLDQYGVQPLREALRFAATAEAFQMIDDASTTVFVPYGQTGRAAIDELRRSGPSRERLRAIQSFGVSVPRQELQRLIAQGAVDLLQDTVYALTSSIHYDAKLGLRTEPALSDGLYA
jgi:CRISPR-associated endonuclease/helicase Cas3